MQTLKQRVRIILDFMHGRYPEPQTELIWKTPWELLVATMLSAQCTDKRVNMVTPHLFSRWQDVQAVKTAKLSEMEAVVHSTGFFRSKAKNVIAAACKIVDEFGGEVPRSMSELTALPGVARKTANVVLSNAFGLQEGIAVDTHVKRLSERLGLTKSQEPKRIEKDLMAIVPQPKWGVFNHYFVLYGREICRSQNPLCTECGLAKICPSVMEGKK